MEKFKKSLITDAGRKMLLGLGAGSSQLTYTKAVLYDQDLSSMEDDQIRALTTMSGEKLSTEIKRVNVKDNTVIAYAVFQNADLTDDVVFRAVGWYAKSSVDSIERLLAISPSIGTQTLASGSPDHRSTAEIDINLAMAISNDVNVTVEVDPTGMVNNQDLDNAIKTVKIELEDKIAKAGQVKSVTMNSTKHDPDSSGNVNLGNALLPGLTSVTVGSDDVDIVYKSGKNRYTADITNALNNVINSAINNSRLTDEQKKAIGITYGDVSTSGSSYATVNKQAVYSDTDHSFKLNNSGTVEALNQLDGKTTKALQKVADLTPDELPNNTDLNTIQVAKDYGLSGINVTNAPYTTGVWATLSVYSVSANNGLQIFSKTTGEGEVFYRVWHNGNQWGNWHKIANTNDIKDSLDITNGKVVNHENRITKLEQNEFTIRHYTKAQEAEGVAWANGDYLHRLAMIDDK